MSANSGNAIIKPDARRGRFAVTIKCKCGQIGSATWEENARLGPNGPTPALLEVSKGFYYFRFPKKDMGRTEIMCAVCESIVPD